jgi:hypothetical protein
MSEKHPDYWEIKSAYQQYRLNELENLNKLRATLIAKGLNPDAMYDLKDADQSITEMPSP